MERKYNINKLMVVLPTTIEFLNKETGQELIVHAHVDIKNDKVYFLGNTVDGIDYYDLEQEVLLSMRPTLMATPIMPEGLGEKVKKLNERRMKNEQVNRGT